MNSRERFAAYLNGDPVDRLPRIESKFTEDIVSLWRSQGFLDDRSPEVFFELDLRESVPVFLRKFLKPLNPEEIWNNPECWYKAEDPRRFPEDWKEWVQKNSKRQHLVSSEPWHEGMFQVLGIHNADSFVKVLLFLLDDPKRVEYVLGIYRKNKRTAVSSRPQKRGAERNVGSRGHSPLSLSIIWPLSLSMIRKILKFGEFQSIFKQGGSMSHPGKKEDRIRN